jgi:Ca2+-binding EF-hand superfamily protein
MSSKSLKRSSSQKKFFQKAVNKLSKIFGKFNKSDREKFERNATKVFRTYDRNGREYISKTNFFKALPKLKLNLDDDLVNSICSQFDYRNGAGVQYLDFIQYCCEDIISELPKVKSSKKKKSSKSSDDESDSEYDSDGSSNGSEQVKLASNIDKVILKAFKQHGKSRFVRYIKKQELDGEAFFDRDGLKSFLKSMKVSGLGNADIKEIIKTFGNEDGEVETEEFVQYFEQKTTSSSDQDMEHSSDDDDDLASTSQKKKAKKILQRLQEVFSEMEEAELEETFDYFDEGGEGYISYKEFKDALKMMKFKINASQLKILIKKLDKDGDKRIDIDEFFSFAGKRKAKKKSSSISSSITKSQKVVGKALSTIKISKIDSKVGEVKTIGYGKNAKIKATDLQKIIGGINKKFELGIKRNDIAKVIDELKDSKGRVLIEAFYGIIKLKNKGGKKKSSSSYTSSFSNDEEEEFEDVLLKAMDRTDDFHLEQQFAKYDKDEEGVVSNSKFRKILQHVGFKPSKSLLNSIIKEFDSENMGEIEYNTFISFCKQFGYVQPAGKRKRKKGKSSSDSDGSEESSEVDASDSDSDDGHKKRNKKKKDGTKSKAGRFDKGLNKEALKEVAKNIANKFNGLVRKGNYSDLEAVFEEIDDANAGRVSVRQLCRVIVDDLKIKKDVIKKKDLKRLIEDFIDANADGQIKYKEFAKFCKSHGKDASSSRFSKGNNSRNRGNDFDDDDEYSYSKKRKLGSLGKNTKKRNGRSRLEEIENKLADRFKDAVQEGEAYSIKEIFDMIDERGRGTLTQRELESAFTKIGFKISREDSNHIFDDLDRDENGTIDVDEFISFCKSHGYQVSRGKRDSNNRRRRDNVDIKDVLNSVKSKVKKMKHKTDIIDTFESNNGSDGFISTKGFENAMRELDFSLTIEEIKMVSKHFESRENRGTVDYDDFLEEMGVDVTNFNAKKDIETEQLEEKIQEAFIECANGGYLDAVKKSFSSQDRNEDGSILLTKFQSIMKDELDMKLTSTEVKIISKKFRARGNSRAIDYSNFLKTYTKAATGGNLKGGTSQQKLIRKIQKEFLKATSGDDEDEVLRTFQAFDDDNEGSIRRRDFNVALKELGIKNLTRSEMDNLARKFESSDDDDRVNYAKFLKECAPHGQEKMRQDMAKRLKRKIRARSTLYSKEQGRHIDLRGEFKAFDTTASGTVSKPDFYQIAKKQAWNLTKEEMRWLFKQFDYENNGRISYVDFTRFASLDKSDIKSIERRLKKIIQSKREAGVKFSEQFEWFDTSGTGKISPNDFKTAMGTLGFPLSDADVELFIDRYDSDYDGKINYSDFLFAFAFDKDEVKKKSESQALTTSVPLKHKDGEAGEWSTGLFYDWTHGLGDAIQKIGSNGRDYGGLPVAGSGTVGEWLERSASPMERRNFFELMFLLSTFEKRLGLQQPDRDSGLEGDVLIQLGSRLKCSLKFST